MTSYLRAKKRMALVLCLFCVGSLSYAWTDWHIYASLEITIVDPDGKPIPDLPVEIRCTRTTTESGEVTEAVKKSLQQKIKRPDYRDDWVTVGYTNRRGQLTTVDKAITWSAFGGKAYIKEGAVCLVQVRPGQKYKDGSWANGSYDVGKTYLTAKEPNATCRVEFHRQ